MLRLLLALLVLAAPCWAAEPARRVALVIGNGSYRNVDRLANPVNDAQLIADTLKELGFTLVGGGAQTNLDKAAMSLAVQAFGKAVQGAEVSLFYYSGHGLQVQGVNWLVPVDANPTRPQDLDFQMLDADLVLRQMEGSGTKLNIMILDACRNNPFAVRGLRATGGGLAEMRAPEGTLISYATQPGAVARDGTGTNSPYTEALARTIRQPGLDIFQTFNRVGLDVKRKTGGNQQPWVSSSPIDGDFAFAAGMARPAPPPLALPVPSPATLPVPPAAVAPPPPAALRAPGLPRCPDARGVRNGNPDPDCGPTTAGIAVKPAAKPAVPRAPTAPRASPAQCKDFEVRQQLGEYLRGDDLVLYSLGCPRH